MRGCARRCRRPRGELTLTLKSKPSLIAAAQGGRRGARGCPPRARVDAAPRRGAAGGGRRNARGMGRSSQSRDFTGIPAISSYKMHRLPSEPVWSGGLARLLVAGVVPPRGFLWIQRPHVPPRKSKPRFHWDLWRSIL